MKTTFLKKYLVPAFHVIFWVLSFNFWNFILNPGVESPAVIQGLEVGWDSMLLLNSALLAYCTLPFVWLIKRRIVWIKIALSALFVAPVMFIIVVAQRSDDSFSDLFFFVDYFLRNFLYVVLFHLPLAFAVYFNIGFLIKKYLNQSHFAIYVAIVSALCLLSAIVGFSSFNFFVDKLFPDYYYISYFKIGELILITAGYLLLTSFISLIWQYAQMLVERRDAAQNELHSLKAQINPHFLFNNLNTIYSMAAQNDQRTPEVILKLSDFLRYILYDTSSETISLEKEVEIIQTYVGLQKERINPEMTSVVFETKGDFSKGQIAPLLLLPLVENCFKHGIGKNKNEIKIHIGFSGGRLLFQTVNNIALSEAHGENGGIGIKNVEKRLNLIYPHRHSLEFQGNNEIFKLEMKIQLV